MNRDEFFAWCAAHGLHSNSAKATAVSVSGQTIINWDRTGKIPGWVVLACIGYEAHLRSGGGRVPRLPRMTVTWFEEWQRRNGLRTYEDTGRALGGLSRQAVHNWFRRGRFPRWVALACVGYEHRRLEDPAAARQGLLESA